MRRELNGNESRGRGEETSSVEDRSREETKEKE